MHPKAEEGRQCMVGKMCETWRF